MAKEFEEVVSIKMKRSTHRHLVAMCKLRGIAFKDLVGAVLEDLIKDDVQLQSYMKKLQELNNFLPG